MTHLIHGRKDWILFALAVCLVLAGLGGAVCWRASIALGHASSIESARSNLKFVSRPVLPATDSGFEWVSSPAAFSSAAELNGHLYVAGPAGLFEYGDGGQPARNFRVGCELPPRPSSASCAEYWPTRVSRSFSSRPAAPEFWLSTVRPFARSFQRRGRCHVASLVVFAPPSPARAQAPAVHSSTTKPPRGLPLAQHLDHGSFHGNSLARSETRVKPSPAAPLPVPPSFPRRPAGKASPQLTRASRNLPSCQKLSAWARQTGLSRSARSRWWA